MPLTLFQFLLTIPITLGVGFLPFVIYRLIKREPLKELLLVYLVATVGLVAIFLLMSLKEHYLG